MVLAIWTPCLIQNVEWSMLKANGALYLSLAILIGWKMVMWLQQSQWNFLWEFWDTLAGCGVRGMLRTMWGPGATAGGSPWPGRTKQWTKRRRKWRLGAVIWALLQASPPSNFLILWVSNFSFLLGWEIFPLTLLFYPIISTLITLSPPLFYVFISLKAIHICFRQFQKHKKEKKLSQDRTAPGGGATILEQAGVGQRLHFSQNDLGQPPRAFLGILMWSLQSFPLCGVFVYCEQT